MKRTMTNQEIINAINVMSIFDTTRLPFQFTRAIVKTLKNLNTEYEIYFEKYKSILEKYLVFDENGQVKRDENGVEVIKEEENRDKLTQEITDLLNEQVEDIEIVQCNSDVLDSVDISISPNEYAFICDYLFKD